MVLKSKSTHVSTSVYGWFEVWTVPYSVESTSLPSYSICTYYLVTELTSYLLI